MAVAFGSAASAGASVACTTGVTVTKPSGLANGDVLYAFVSKTNFANTADFTCSGWTDITTGTRGTTTGNDRHYTILRKIVTDAAGEPADYTFVTTFATVCSICATIIRVTGADTTDPENIPPELGAYGTNDSSPLSRAATTLWDGCLVLQFCQLSLASVGQRNWGVPSGYTEPASGGSAGAIGSSLNNQHGVAYKTQVTAGAVGTNAWTHTAEDATVETLVTVVVVQPIKESPWMAGEGTITSALTTDTTATPVIPSHVADDILICCAVNWAPVTAGDLEEPTISAGWTSLFSNQNVSTPIDGWARTWWRRATGSGTTNPTVTRTGDTGADTGFQARCYVIRGCAVSGDPWEDAQRDPTNLSYTTLGGTFPPLTCSGAHRMAVQFYLSMDNQTHSTTTGWIAGVAGNSVTGTGIGFRANRKDDISVSTTADVSNVSAPVQGGYAFHGVMFKPPSADPLVPPFIVSQAIQRSAVH